MVNRTSLPRLVTRVLSDVHCSLSDRQLLDKYAASCDESAFAAILDRHGPMILAMCRRLLSDAHLAEDVLQATFLVLARKPGSIRRRESLASWLYGVAKRLARQAQLAQAARTRREEKAAEARRRNGERDRGWDELLQLLDEELERLPEKLRSPLILCYLQGRTQDEAARHLGLTLSTCHRRLERGRQILRARMIQRGATLGGGLCALFVAPSAVRATLIFGLRRSVLTTALAGAKGLPIPASIALLAKGGLPMVSGIKLVLWTLLAIGISGGLAGAFWSRVEGRGATGEEKSASGAPLTPPVALAAAPAKEPRLDRAAVPLPKGASARLGTLAFRHGSQRDGALTFSPDGKSLISTGRGWIRKWDLQTGEALVNLGDGGRAARWPGTTLTTADGTLARLGINVQLPGGGVVWECTEHEFARGRERTYRIQFPRDTRDAHGLPPYLSPDGKTYAGLTHQGALTLWNASSGDFTHYLKPQGGAYTAIAFPPGGKTILVGDDTHTFRVFDVATAKLQRSFGLLEGNVVALMALSPDGKWLATAGGKKGPNPSIWPHDCFIRLWNLSEGTVVRTLEFPEDYGARSLAFTPDSRTLLAGIRGGTKGSPAAVRSWQVPSGKPGRAWTSDAAVGLAIAVSPNGKVLATMNDNGVIRLWDMATGKERRIREASPCSLEAVCFRTDGKTVVTMGTDLALRQWDAASGRLLSPPRTLEKSGSVLGFSGAGAFLVSHYWQKDNTTLVRLHDAKTGKFIAEQPGYLGIVSPDGKRLAFADKDRGHIRVLEMGTWKEIHKLPVEPKGNKPKRHYQSFPRAFTPDGQSLVVQGDAVSVWDLRTGKRKSSWSLTENKVLVIPENDRGHSWERIEAMAISPNGGLIAISLLKDRPAKNNNVEWFGRLMVFQTATGKVLHQADLEHESMHRLAFSPDGKLLAGGGNWTVRIWKLAEWNSPHTFEGHRGKITSLAFSPDGRSLASASEDSTVLIWDVAGGSP
jgi:RNA polymerase sigma factor (sigma-70 family)